MVKKNEFLSVVIAAFNEENNIIPLTKRIINTLEKDYNYEIIYVIAGEDNTYNNIKKVKNKNIKIFYSKKPNGLGSDFKTGFSNISKKTNYVITMDADLNHQPEEIPRLLKYSKEFDIIIGSRHVKGSIRKSIPFWKRTISDFTNFFFTILSGLKVNDKTSGFRLYKKKAIDKISNIYKCKNFEFLMEILLIAKKLNMRIKEVPITFKYRICGESKFKFLKTGQGYLKLLFKYH